MFLYKTSKDDEHLVMSSAVTSEVHGHRAVVQYMCQCLPRIFTGSTGVVTLLAPPLGLLFVGSVSRVAFRLYFIASEGSICTAFTHTVGELCSQHLAISP